MQIAARALWYRAASHRIARALSSPRLTVAGLGYLFVLVLAGTLHQANHGIYETQLLFFRSWIARVGPVPIPGAQPALLVVAVNLLASLAFRIRWIRSNTGLALMHVGLILLLLGGLGTTALSRSSLLGLVEGQQAEVSHDPYRWELHLATPGRLVTLPFERLGAGTRIESPIAGLEIELGRSLIAARPIVNTQGQVVGTTPVMPDRDAEKNLPSLALRLGPRDGGRALELWGGDERPLRVEVGDETFDLWLGRKAYPLPTPLRLLSFDAEFHPGTQVPRRFQSTVLVGDGEGGREAIITMNRPLTLSGHTLYQTSWARDAEGRLISVLEVVSNPARPLPYLSSLVILAGLVAHVVLRRGAAA